MKSLSLLIVEPERIIARDLQMMLVGWGYQVVAIAATGPQAIALALQHRPDLMLIDIYLKDTIDGISTAQAICAHYPIPVVFFTDNTNPSIQQRIGQNITYHLLSKPFDEQALLATLQTALAHSGNNQRSDYPNSQFLPNTSQTE